jgi:hypothetical protein
MILHTFAAALALIALAAAPMAAGEEKLRIIGRDKAFVVEAKGGNVTITRVMTDCALNKGWLQPMVPVEGVTPVGEIEVLKGLNGPATLVVDMREVEWFAEATIPAARHIPYTEVAGRLDELAARNRTAPGTARTPRRSSPSATDPSARNRRRRSRRCIAKASR